MGNLLRTFLVVFTVTAALLTAGCERSLESTWDAYLNTKIEQTPTSIKEVDVYCFDTKGNSFYGPRDCDIGDIKISKNDFLYRRRPPIDSPAIQTTLTQTTSSPRSSDKYVCNLSLTLSYEELGWNPVQRELVQEAKKRGFDPESCAALIDRKEGLAAAFDLHKNTKTDSTLNQSKNSYETVRSVQEQLAILGYKPGTVDGVMGNSTEMALKNFQYSHVIAGMTGKIDDRTILALDLEIKKRLATSSPSETPEAVTRIKKLKSTQAKDTTPPTIAFDLFSLNNIQSDSPTIRGRITDNGRVAQATIEGRTLDIQPNGNFSFTRYVPSTGTTVRIEAIDEWGNKSSKTVKLIRSITDTSDQITFASLDPTKISGRSNRDAIALVIGVADYTRAPKAVYADSDASVFSDYARRALGVPRSNIKILVNNGAALTDLKLNVKQWLRGRIEKGKTDVYVFYAGHGLASPDGEDLYLLPYDGVPSLLEDTSLQRNELFDVIANAKPKSATIFLDTCYSGLSRGEETLLASARPILITPKHQSVPKGFTVFSAASGQQISSGLDEAKHGLFSYYLMKGMEGPADTNSDRKITVGELHTYVQKNVKQQAIRMGREQIPELQGDAERVLVRW